jgi:hypothetical protein
MQQAIVPILSNGLGNQMSCIAGAFELSRKLPPCRKTGKRRKVFLDRLNVFRGYNVHEKDGNPSALKFWPQLPNISSDVVNMKQRVTYTEDIFKIGRYLNPRAIATGTNVLYMGFSYHHTASLEVLKDTVTRYAVIPALSESLSVLAGGLGHLENALFFHVRRGDFYGPIMNRATFGLNLHERYYRLALGHFTTELNNGARVLVCSDDIKWCKAMLPGLYPEVPNAAWAFSESSRADDTLVLMASCSLGGIAANSSLSWWGMVLGKYKAQTPPQRRTYVLPQRFFRALWPIHSIAETRIAVPVGCLALDTGDSAYSFFLVYACIITLLALGMFMRAWIYVRTKVRVTNNSL